MCRYSEIILMIKDLLTVMFHMLKGKTLLSGLLPAADY